MKHIKNKQVYESIKSYSDEELDLIKSMVNSYIIFHDQFDLESTNTHGLIDKVTNGDLNTNDLRRIIKVLNGVDSLPCVDPLWDRYFKQDVIDWLGENEEFSLEAYIKQLL